MPLHGWEFEEQEMEPNHRVPLNPGEIVRVKAPQQ
jgi:hypothetical protein